MQRPAFPQLTPPQPSFIIHFLPGIFIHQIGLITVDTFFPRGMLLSLFRQCGSRNKDLMTTNLLLKSSERQLKGAQALNETARFHIHQLHLLPSEYIKFTYSLRASGSLSVKLDGGAEIYLCWAGLHEDCGQYM